MATKSGDQLIEAALHSNLSGQHKDSSIPFTIKKVQFEVICLNLRVNLKQTEPGLQVVLNTVNGVTERKI